uniref:MCF.2 cell line derived transforming sequence-like 2 n=1 Tax=Callorhinchus milii TaxID=7868 RepID=A0A4W3HM04_CALMI
VRNWLPRSQGCFCSFSADEIMQQEIRPLLAVDIIEQLQKQFAILSGGRSKDGAPIITFPEYSTFPDLPDQDFLNVLTYLTSIPSLHSASIGFIIIIDRRRDKWSSVKASLTRIAVSGLTYCLRYRHNPAWRSGSSLAS